MSTHPSYAFTSYNNDYYLFATLTRRIYVQQKPISYVHPFPFSPQPRPLAMRIFHRASYTTIHNTSLLLPCLIRRSDMLLHVCVNRCNRLS